MSLAQPPSTRKASTSSPTAPPPEAISVSGPIAVSTPAISYPTPRGNGPRLPSATCEASAGFTPAARTSTVTSPDAGGGTSYDTKSKTSRPPGRAATQCCAMNATTAPAGPAFPRLPVRLRRAAAPCQLDDRARPFWWLVTSAAIGRRCTGATPTHPCEHISTPSEPRESQRHDRMPGRPRACEGTVALRVDLVACRRSSGDCRTKRSNSRPVRVR